MIMTGQITAEVLGGRLDGTTVRMPVGTWVWQFPLISMPSAAMFEFEQDVHDVSEPQSVALLVHRCLNCGKYWLDGRAL